MKLNWKPCLSLNKHNHFLVKLAVAILLMGLAFRLFFFRSEEFPAPDLESPVVDKTEVVEAKPPVVFAVDVSEYEDQNPMPQNGD